LNSFLEIATRTVAAILRSPANEKIEAMVPMSDSGQSLRLRASIPPMMVKKAGTTKTNVKIPSTRKLLPVKLLPLIVALKSEGRLKKKKMAGPKRNINEMTPKRC
jgi:hypothetical protein